MDYSSDRSIMCCRFDTHRNVWAACGLTLFQTLHNDSQQHSTTCNSKRNMYHPTIWELCAGQQCRVCTGLNIIVTWYACGLFRGMTLWAISCLPVTKSFPKIHLEIKWNTTFWVVPAENFWEQRNIWKGNPILPEGIFQTEIRVPVFQSTLWYQFQASAVVFLVQMVNAIPGLTSPVKNFAT